MERSLSPEQIRKGFMAYMGDPECNGFPPQPGDIVRLAPEGCTDKPRRTTKPDCPDCRGTGQRLVEVDAKPTDVFYKPGKKRRVVIYCLCVRVVYGGREFMPEQPQMPAAPTSPEEENRQAAEALANLSEKLPQLKDLGKAIPERREMSDEEKIRRRDQMKAELKSKGLIQ